MAIKKWKSRIRIEKLISEYAGSEHPDLYSAGSEVRTQYLPPEETLRIKF